MLNISILSTLVFFLQTAAIAQSGAPQAAPVTAPAIQLELSHQPFDAILQQYVSEDGKVDYKGLKADKESLYTYCQSLSDMPVQEDWSREAKMAYWINAYNAFTLKLIVDNYPTKTIMNFDGGKTWDVRRIKIGNKKYSLNNIENDILRPTFKDPRIHFAVNCAARASSSAIRLRLSCVFSCARAGLWATTRRCPCHWVWPTNSLLQASALACKGCRSSTNSP